jgi:hypothetical protein
MKPRSLIRALTFSAVTAAAGSLTNAASACAVCGTGDQTLTATGTEQPYAGMFRSVLEMRYLTDRLGRPGVDEVSIRELRTDVMAVWAPHANWFLMADVPLAYRQVSEASLARTETWGLGEVELSAKWFVLRERPFAPRWQLALLGGIKFPTAARRENAVGELIAAEAQLGTQSLDAFGGAALSTSIGPWAAYSSIQWFEPLLIRAPIEPGRSLRASVAAQYQAGASVALRVLADARWDQHGRESGERDPNSGGAIVFAGPELLVSPFEGTLWQLGLRLPIVEALDGAHTEGAIWRTAVAVDW